MLSVFWLTYTAGKCETEKLHFPVLLVFIYVELKLAQHCLSTLVPADCDSCNAVHTLHSPVASC